VTSSAAVVAAEVRRGERLARDAVAGALTLVEAQQERLNTATLIDGERALARADEIDRLVESGTDPGPLAGVPIALKDLIDHAGRPTRCGSSFFERVPERSATVVERLEDAGAVIVSRTGLHEFAFGFSSENPWTGPVRNPLDSTLSPGGSSGGSAAAVGGGQVPVAIGTDTGGSVRVPAALCGVFGLKVTHGRIPLTGVFPLAPSLDTVGPIAAGVEDLTLAYRVMAGFDPLDPWSRDEPVVESHGPRPDLKGLRIGIPVRWLDDAPVVEPVAVAFADAMAGLQSLGAVVTEIDDEALSPSAEVGRISAAEAASVHRAWIEEGRAYGAEAGARLRAAMDVTLDDYLAACAWRAKVRGRAEAAFRQVDVIATPATGATRKPIGVDELEIDGSPIHYRTPLSIFAALVNTIGCPAIVGPLPSSHVPPPSLQLVGPWWREHRLLDVAATLEREGVMVRPPA
jgi:Asp-tRNA(Asn)/Glu-tRNA(Gln) amidotransferase A subunit family amidase